MVFEKIKQDFNWIHLDMKLPKIIESISCAIVLFLNPTNIFVGFNFLNQTQSLYL